MNSVTLLYFIILFVYVKDRRFSAVKNGKCDFELFCSKLTNVPLDPKCAPPPSTHPNPLLCDRAKHRAPNTSSDRPPHLICKQPLSNTFQTTLQLYIKGLASTLFTSKSKTVINHFSHQDSDLILKRGFSTAFLTLCCFVIVFKAIITPT